MSGEKTHSNHDVVESTEWDNIGDHISQPSEEQAETETPEEKLKRELREAQQKLREAKRGMFNSRVHERIASDHPNLSQRYNDALDILNTPFDEENIPSDEEKLAVIRQLTPVFEEYRPYYEETEETLNREYAERRTSESHRKQIFNYLYADRFPNRSPIYTPYDLSASKAIPPEYEGMTFEEAKALIDDRRAAEANVEDSALLAESTDETESETIKEADDGKKEAVEDFYSDIDLSQESNQEHYEESIGIFMTMDLDKFPSEIVQETIEQDQTENDDVAEERESWGEEQIWSEIHNLQEFGTLAAEAPTSVYGGRDFGTDDRVLLGDRYNTLTGIYQKNAEWRSKTFNENMPVTLIKKFCHELASLIHEYQEMQESWRKEGQRCLTEALDAYADIYGQDAVVEQFGSRIPEDPDQIDRYSIFPLIQEINSIIRESWKSKITSIDDYVPGQPYSLLCSRVINPFSAKEYRNEIFSSSLLTNEHHEMIGDRAKFGFILPPDNIIAAAGHDIYTHNWIGDDQSAVRGDLPIVHSYDQVLGESSQNGTYSEIITRDQPIGIFYFKDKIDDESRQKLEEFIALNPDLPVIELES